MSATFEEIVRAWLLSYDDRLPNDKKSRREAFIVLLANLADHGHSKEELSNSKKEKIIRHCVNPNHKNKSKLRKWVDILVNDLESAIMIYYPTVTIRKDVLTPDMESKLESMDQRAKESHALKTPDDGGEDDTSERPLIGNVEPLNIYDAVKNSHHSKAVPQSEEFAITDDMIDEMDGPNIIYDTDFYKKLGITNE